MSFYGASALDGNVSIYVFNITSKSASEILKALSTENIENMESTFNKTVAGNYKIYPAVLGDNGDILNYDLGAFDQGQYCIVIAQRNEDGSRKALSSIAFVVPEYDLEVSAPASINEGSNLDISMGLKSISNNNGSPFEYTCDPAQQDNDTLNFSNRSLALNHFLALCFVPAYNLLGFKLKEIKSWLLKNKNVKPELTHSPENGQEAWMAFWHGVGMIFEILPDSKCSKIIFYLPGGYKDFLEELMNEYLVPAGENKWIQESREKISEWSLLKNTGTHFWELNLTEIAD